MRTPEGDVSVPITHAYNHHYCAYMSGSLSELRQVTGKLSPKHYQYVLSVFSSPGDLSDDHGMNNHGSPM